MNERIRELAEQAKLRPALLLKHLGTFAALTDSEQEELKNIEKFAELVQADEREACAKTVEQAGIDGYGTLAAAAMVRARSEK
jgi:hypothetical protein